MRGRREAGAGLVEIAVALLVLSIGALALAAGQLAARKATSEALQRSEAVRMAQGLMELLPGSAGDLAAYRFDELAAVVEPGRDCRAQRCDHAQWAAWNLWQWRAELEGKAASDDQGNAVAGLIDPAACLSVALGVAALQLSWRIIPGGGNRSCSDLEPGATIRVLRLATQQPVRVL